MKHNYYFFKKQFILLVCITIFSCKEAENLKEATSFKNTLSEIERSRIQAEITIQKEIKEIQARGNKFQTEIERLQARRERNQ